MVALSHKTSKAIFQGTGTLVLPFQMRTRRRLRSIMSQLLIRRSWLGTSPGLGQRPSCKECNRSSISVAFLGPASPLPHHTIVSPSKVLPAPLLNYQLGQLWPAGFLLASPLIGQVYHIGTDDDDETLLLVGPLTLREAIVPNNANESKACSFLAPPPLPEYVVEVAP